MLVAGFIAPLLIDWNSFRDTFERRASAILGQPVRIVGDIDVSLLPSTTVTLRDIEVGDIEGEPMARLERFEMRLELLPLLSGQYNVSEMKLDRPRVVATVDDAGRLDWLMRLEGASSVDLEKVSLSDVTITDGSIRFFDARTGGSFDLTQINTNLLEAGSLTGPWRVEGTLLCRADQVCGEALPVTFNVATGRLGPEDTMRVSAELTPASAALAGTLRAEGEVRSEEDLLAYAGDFSFDRLATGAALGEGLTSAWTIEGGFELTSEILSLQEFVWDSADGLYVLSGSGTLTLGDDAAFAAELTSRQIDLDRALGEEAGGAVSISEAMGELWRRAAEAIPPELAGRFSITVPSVIVADSVLQNIEAEIVAAGSDWTIDSLRLRLPGQSLLDLAGRFDPEGASFAGLIELSSEQPQVLADWWMGGDVGELMLDPFTLASALTIESDAARLDDAVLAIGENELSGDLEWRMAADEGADIVNVELRTERFAFDQLAALADLIVGEPTTEADYALRLDADIIEIGTAVAGDVVIDGSLSRNELSLAQLTIGDLDGAALAMDGNWIGLDGGANRGTINATASGSSMAGITLLAAELGLGGDLLDRLELASPTLSPFEIEAVLSASVASGFAYSLDIDGVAAGTTFRIEAKSNAGPENWALAEADIVMEFEAADTALLARQAGFTALAVEEPLPADIDITLVGVPSDGMTLTLQSRLAGVSVPANGTLFWDGAGTPRFAGAIEIIGDIGPLLAIAGVDLPNAGNPVPAFAAADVSVDGDVISVVLAQSSVAERSVAGEVQLADISGERVVTGALAVEEVDLGWLATLPLGVEPLPSKGADPWPDSPFTGAMLGGLGVELDISADRLVVSDDLAIGNADLSLQMGGTESRLNLRSGSLSTGIVTGEVVLEVEAGQALMDGQLFLADVPIDALAWRNDGQPVAEGVLSFAAEFTALGRSPAALASALSGTGSLGIRGGVFYFLGADAFDLVIRLADEDVAMTEDGLRESFTNFLDAGTLAFGDDDIAFDIAAGILTPQPVRKDVGDVRLVIRAPIDLAQLTLDASFEMILNDDRDIEDGPQARAFVTFAGPIAEPERSVNVAPLAGYLSLRRLRETDQLQAEVLERERFIRIIERIEADIAGGFGGPAEPAAPASPG